MYKSALDPHIAIRHLNEEIKKIEVLNLNTYYMDDKICNNLRIEAYKERIKMYS